ncbi:MAG: PAS domain S-box protein [Sphingobacteriaceae bacterium]|nr:MAG: PAS domain S-box protein [Sphingobacteriaceae bacterium]
MKLSTIKFVCGYLLFCLSWLIVTRGLLLLFHNSLTAEVVAFIVLIRPYCFTVLSGLLIWKMVIINNKSIIEREQDFQSVYLGNPNPMWIYDPVTFKFLSVNKAAVKAYGYTEKEFLSLTILDIRPETDRDAIKKLPDLPDDTFRTGLKKHQNKSGEVIYANITSHKIRFQRKDAVMVLAVDTTERVQHEQQLKQMNQDLQEEKQKLKETEKLAKVSGWELFLDDWDLIWSEELYEIFEFDPAEKVTYPMVLQTVYPEDLPAYNQAVENLLLHGEDLDVAYRYLSKNKEIKYVKVLGKMQYQNGKMFKVNGTMQDVTELTLIQLEKNKYSKLLNNTLQNINDGYCALNRNWIFTDVNPNCEKLLNLKREDIIGRNYLSIFPEAPKWNFYHFYKKVLDQQVFVSFEELYYPTQRWFCVNAYPTDEGAVIFFTDITEIKRKDLLLKEALERYDLVARATHDVIYDYDVRRRKIAYSDNITELMNLENEEVKQDVDWWKNHIHPDDLHKVVQVYQHAIHYKQENCGMEYRLKTGVNQYKFVYDQGYLQFNDQGKFMRMIGAIKDIDQLKRFDDENKRLAEIITKVNNMIIIQDVNNKITWVNKAFENSSGYYLHEVIGKYPQELLNGPETDLTITQSIIAAKNKLENFSYDIINYKKNGEKYWVNIEFTPLFTPDGKPDGYISIHTDITIRKEKAERINRQNKILKDIAWMSSHELRRPVASILGLIGLINETDDCEERNTAISMMNTCTQHLDEIIHNINHKIEMEITEK